MLSDHIYFTNNIIHDLKLLKICTSKKIFAYRNEKCEITSKKKTKIINLNLKNEKINQNLARSKNVMK